MEASVSQCEARQDSHAHPHRQRHLKGEQSPRRKVIPEAKLHCSPPLSPEQRQEAAESSASLLSSWLACRGDDNLRGALLSCGCCFHGEPA